MVPDPVDEFQALSVDLEKIFIFVKLTDKFSEKNVDNFDSGADTTCGDVEKTELDAILICSPGRCWILFRKHLATLIYFS